MVLVIFCSRCARVSCTISATCSYSSCSRYKNAKSSSSHLIELIPSLSAKGAYTSMVSRALKFRRWGGSAASVRILCKRSASLMIITRMSLDIAKNILRRLRACFSSIELTSMEVSLVTPSTKSITVSPKRLRISSSVADVSSTVSCKSAAQIESSSICKSFAKIKATSTGWLM